MMSDNTDKNRELEELFSGGNFDREQEQQIFKDAKRKSYLRIGAISSLIGIILIVLLVLVKMQTAPYLVARRIAKVENQYAIQGANLHLSAWNEQRDLSSKTSSAVRYKLVEGIPVFEGTVNVPGNNWYQTVQRSSGTDWLSNQYEDLYTPYGSKVMQFLWPQARYEKSVMDFDRIRNLREGEAAELGISFDKAYSYEEIKGLLPENIDLVWCWVDVLEGDASGAEVEERGLIEEEGDVFGFAVEAHHEESDVKQSMADFSESMKKDMKQEIDVGSKSLAGVVVTGSSEELLQLENQFYVRAASLGAVVTIY